MEQEQVGRSPLRGSGHSAEPEPVPVSAASAASTPNAWEHATGYSDAFYQIGRMLGIPAQDRTPSQVWHEQMRPMLEQRLASHEALEEALRECADKLWVLRCKQADENAADLLFNRETSPTLHARAKGVLARHRSEAVEELVKVLERILSDEDVALSRPDYELARTLISKHRGEQG